MDDRLLSEEPRPTRTTWIVALTIALAGYLVWQFVPTSSALLDPDAQPRSVTPRGELTPQEKQVTQLFQSVSPSVVYIRNRVESAADVDARGRRRDPTVVREGTGSGFVWDSAGHIVTNYHVIHVDPRLEALRHLEVALAGSDPKSGLFDAQVVGFEVEKDIAVLKIAAPQSVLPPIALGSSADLLVGQSVYAIGNPFGLDQTLTHGLISGLERDMPAMYYESGRGQHWITGVIQTDAAINPGNSGGALLDSAGRLIGMNTAIHSDTGENTGIGFAIPVDMINRIVTDILRYGQARRPGLGVKVLTANNVRGVIIDEVQPGSASERAGLKSAVYERAGDRKSRIVTADVIVGVNGKKVEGPDDLFLELDRHQAGDKVKLDIVRDSERLKVEVELQYLPSQQ
jgi:S1-C subfamily serine protease